MRTLVVLLVLGSTFIARGQDVFPKWMSFVNPEKYQLFYNKYDIPKEFLPYINYDYDHIASAGEKYQVGCVNTKNLPSGRMNWLAKDDAKHWIMSISYGGRVSGTYYYYFSKENDQIWCARLMYNGIDSKNLTLDQTHLKYIFKEYSVDSVEVGLKE